MQELTNSEFGNVLSAAPMRAFDPSVLGFLDDVSQKILNTSTTRQFPDLATLGFFLRRKNLDRIGRGYLGDGKVFLMGRGLAFHVGPANVPLNFAYSLVASLLAGNPSVVRVSSRPFPQVDLFVDALNAAFDAAKMSNRVSILRYGHDSAMNERLSQACDIRVIWGGDHTIQTFASIPVPARATEIHFANRYSAAVIDARDYLETCEAQEVAQKFYNDVYPFEQNACTAPKLVFWLGEDVVIRQAKERFWSELKQTMHRAQYQPAEGVGVRHFKSVAQLAVEAPIRRSVSHPSLTVIEAETASACRLDHGASEGFFLERSIQHLGELSDALDQRCQTLAFVGDLKTDILSCVAEHGMKGVDRVVPVGTAGHFSFVWEGKDLIRLMSRSFEL